MLLLDNALHVLIFIVLGAALGYIGGLLGIGGGLIAIPILGVAFGFSEQAAQGTALVMIVPNVLVGLWHYVRKIGLDLRIAATLAASAIPFTYLAARYATSVPSKPLRIAFGCFVLAIALQMAYRSLATQRREARLALPWPYSAIVGAIGGTLSGLFSVGGAVFSVPVMSSLFGLSQVEAQGMGLALVAPGTLVSIATFAASRDVQWVTGVALALAGILTVPHGVALAKRLPERVLRLLFVVLMLASAIGLFLRA